MLISKLIRCVLILAIIMHIPIAARDIIVEFKGAFFHPTDSCFKALYGSAAALFGPEITVDICNTKKWYAFASIDYLKKNGCSIGLCNTTTMRMLPLAFGLKYFKPVGCADLYAGLGFQPIHLKTSNCSPHVIQHTSRWGIGGIAKLGAYLDLPCNLLLDLFVDYSFVKTACPQLCQPELGTLLSRKANISGVILGVGLGYRFN